MEIHQKVFCIVKNDTKQIVSFGLNAREVQEEWELYYEGTEEANTHHLLKTFMPQSEIKKQMNIN